MEVGAAGFPQDWLADAAQPASDVELALLLVNSHGSARGPSRTGWSTSPG